MTAPPLTGRHALVTGAARGIGAEIARALAADGAVLTLLGRNLDKLKELATQLPGGPHHAVAADVCDEAAVARAFDEARAQAGPVQILVNNAGQAESALLHKTSLELWNRMLAVNLTGSFLCARAALPDMLPRAAAASSTSPAPPGWSVTPTCRPIVRPSTA